MATLAQLNADLVEVRAAISAILAGAQSYTINGRSLTRASITALYAERSRLELAVSRATTGSVSYPVFGAR